jgi:hypothetical protein
MTTTNDAVMSDAEWNAFCIAIVADLRERNAEAKRARVAQNRASFNRDIAARRVLSGYTVAE